MMECQKGFIIKTISYGSYKIGTNWPRVIAFNFGINIAGTNVAQQIDIWPYWIDKLYMLCDLCCWLDSKCAQFIKTKLISEVIISKILLIHWKLKDSVHSNNHASAAWHLSCDYQRSLTRGHFWVILMSNMGS